MGGASLQSSVPWEEIQTLCLPQPAWFLVQLATHFHAVRAWARHLPL